MVAPGTVEKSDSQSTQQPQSYWAEIDGQKMHYLKAGSGPPLLLVHGLLGGSFCWRYNIPLLSRTRTVFAVDMVGLGLSDAPRTADCSMRAQAARLDRFLADQVLADPVVAGQGLSQVDVVGSSWGGAVSLFLASSSDRVRSLVLAAPVNPWSDFGRKRIDLFSGRITGSVLPAVLPYSRPFQRPWLERLYGDVTRVPPGTMEGYAALLTRRGRGHNIVNILRGWSDDVAALRGAISRVRAPSKLVWGSKDLAVDPRSANALQASLPVSDLVLLPGVGHLPFEESPQEFNAIVLEFLGRTSE